MTESPLEKQSLEAIAEYLLKKCTGLDINDPQERDTPRRFVKALKELTTPEEFEFTMFDASTDNMVIQKDLEFATLCRHHVLPFVGTAHFGYVPDGRIVGISKIPRLINYHAAGLNTQEELTETLADAFMEKLEPLGVILVMEAQHTCMSIRGVRARGTTRTTSVRGVFADHSRTAKAEFMEAIR
jgi:GTP cyclohydrolase I